MGTEQNQTEIGFACLHVWWDVQKWTSCKRTTKHGLHVRPTGTLFAYRPNMQTLFSFNSVQFSFSFSCKKSSVVNGMRKILVGAGRFELDPTGSTARANVGKPMGSYSNLPARANIFCICVERLSRSRQWRQVQICPCEQI